MTNLEGYEYFKNENGKTMAIEKATGEIIDTFWMCLPFGTQIKTPDGVTTQRSYLQQKTQNHLKRITNSDLGKFFFVSNQEEFKDLLPQTVTRLIYLNTFIHYGDNKLMKTERTPMEKSDLAKILGISKAAVTKFWKEVSPKYIAEKENNLIFTNTDVFIRRKLNQRGGFNPYQKFYMQGIRKLYEITAVTQHKHLGYVFKMLPYINLEFNVLCRNPLETDLERIEPLSLKDFCAEIGYDTSQINRLLNIYRKLTFDVKGKQENFCAFVFDGINRNKSKIFINPNVLYNGSNYQRVKILGMFCRN